MHDTSHDAFALKNSGLDAFLYAHVGAETNGSSLTILSGLARLGLDPWAQAASWAALPKAGAIDGLAQSIDQMPLTPVVLAQSRDIAARLVQLLPGKPWPAMLADPGAANPAAPSWTPITMICCGVAVGIVLTVLLMLKPPADIITPIEPPRATSRSTAPAAVRLEPYAPARAGVSASRDSIPGR